MIHKLSEHSENLIKYIGKHFLSQTCLQNISNNILDPCNFLPLDAVDVGPECEKFLYNQTPEFSKKIKSTCVQFYITLMEEMLKRLPYNDTLFRGLRFLNGKIALKDEERSNFRDLTDIAAYFGNFDVTALALEWKILPFMFIDADKEKLATLSCDEMWKKIFEMKDTNNEPIFPTLEKLVYAALSLPHSNAEAERIFSIVTDVKNKKRNRLNIETLNAICKTRSSFQAQHIDCRNFKVDSRHLELHNSSNLYSDNKKKIFFKLSCWYLDSLDY